MVDRRAPLNPLKTINNIRKLKTGNTPSSPKVHDPMLKNNPLIGRLPVTIMLNSAIFIIFLSELVFNKVSFNGRCISKVLYPRIANGANPTGKPYLVELGYGACEHNLMTDAYKNVFFGDEAKDDGWPRELVHTPKYAYGGGEAGPQSPNQRIFSIIGGLNTNMIRNYNEVFRLFWSMFMHGNWYHIAFNLFCQVQALWIIEPDWGFLRTLLLFLLSGLGGNLVSATLDPCGTTVGSSGAMYGLYGAMIPYCIEYWTSIPRPFFLLCYNVVTLAIGLLLGLTSHIDNYAHLGGCAVGMLWGFATIKSISSCDKCTLVERSLLSPIFSWALGGKLKAKLTLAAAYKKDRGNRKREIHEAKKQALQNGVTQSRMSAIKKKFDRQGAPPCRMRLREWFIRIVALFTLACIFLISTLFVFNPTLYVNYTPPGQYKFSGWQTCTCCFVKRSGRLFREADMPSRYVNEQLYWCFDSVGHAKAYCGDDYESTRETFGILQSSQNAAGTLLSNVNTVI